MKEQDEGNKKKLLAAGSIKIQTAKKVPIWIHVNPPTGFDHYDATDTGIDNHEIQFTITQLESGGSRGTHKRQLAGHQYLGTTITEPLNKLTAKVDFVALGGTTTKSKDGPVQTNSGTGGGGKK